MQKILFDYDSINNSSFPTGEAVRNATYHNVVEPNITRRQMEVYEIIISNPGITSKGISRILDKPLHTFSGRLSELANPKRYDKPPYHNPPLIVAHGVEYEYDYENKSQPYSKYYPIDDGGNGF